MNTLVIVLIAAVCLFGAYALYGRWLANKWGIDPTAKTPAVVHEDGRDYVPTDGWTVFAHQFSSIAGAGPVTGAIQAAAFGWLPVLLWVLLGGIFFGAVTDFGALYASVKNDGKSMGMLIEKYIGKTGRKLFLLFCWLFCGIVIAAFADMVAGTFNAFGADGAWWKLLRPTVLPAWCPSCSWCSLWSLACCRTSSTSPAGKKTSSASCSSCCPLWWASTLLSSWARLHGATSPRLHLLRCRAAHVAAEAAP